MRDSKPVGGVDFKLTPGTIIRGTVIVGPGNRPAANQFIVVDETGEPAPADLPKRETGAERDIRRQFGATTDSEGHYSIRVGPGSYTLMGPPRTGNEKLAITAETEVVRDFRMPRPPKGTITGRVVLAGARDKGVAWAKVQIAAVNMMSIPFAVKADAQGRFQSERELDPLFVCAPAQMASWGRLSKSEPKTPRSRFPSHRPRRLPAFCSMKKARSRQMKSSFWGRRVFLDEDQQSFDDVLRPEGLDPRRRTVHATGVGSRPGI